MYTNMYKYIALHCAVTLHTEIDLTLIMMPLGFKCFTLVLWDHIQGAYFGRSWEDIGVYVNFGL